MAAGFAWGLRPHQAAAAGPQRAKRSYDDSENIDYEPYPVRARALHKRSRQHTVPGEPLPVARLVELMLREELQRWVLGMVQNHPELAPEISAQAAKPSVATLLELLGAKLQAVLAALPYKVDPASDYAYVRVKPPLDEFYAACSEYTLLFLAPVESNPMTLLDFLEGITLLLHQLPTWSNPDFHYRRVLAYERIAHTWVLVLRACEERLPGKVLLLAAQLESQIQRHHERAPGVLQPVVELLRDIRLDQGLEHANFSSNNSPLHKFEASLVAEGPI